MADKKPKTTTKVVNAVKPWSRDASWWVLAIEAAVAIGLGVYVLTQVGSASTLLSYALAIFLVVDGLLALFNGLRGRGGKLFGPMRAGVSLLGGAIVLLMPVLGFGNAATAGWILGLAFLASGVFGAIGRIFESNGRIGWAGVLVSVLMAVIGLLYIYSVMTQDVAVLMWMGWLLLAVGIMLGIYAAFVWSQDRKSTATVQAG